MSTSEPHAVREKFHFGVEPSAFRVGSITKRVRELKNGVHRVAEHKGLVLWAQIANGHGVDFRAFDEGGKEVGVVIFTEPDPRLTAPTAQELRPQKKGKGEVFADDAGSHGCPYVCACLGDGGYVCWQQC